MLLLRVFCLMTIASSFIFAQDSPQISSKVVDRAPANAEASDDSHSQQLTFEKQSHDFGVVQQTDALTTVFRFAHSGYDPIEIIKLEADCGCTVPALEKRVFEPGEIGTLKVAFDPSQFVGAVSKKIIVRFAHGSEEEMETELNLKATIIAEINYVPNRVTLQDVDTTAPTTTNISVKAMLLKKLEITNVKTYPDWLSASLSSNSETENDVQLILNPNLFPEGQSHIRGYLTFTTNAETQRHIRIPIDATLRLPYSVTPESVMFWNVTAADATPVDLKIQSANDLPIEIEEWQASLPYLKVSAEQNILSVTLEDNAPAGRLTGFVTVNFKMGEEQHLLTIPVRGKLKEK